MALLNLYSDYSHACSGCKPIRKCGRQKLRRLNRSIFPRQQRRSGPYCAESPVRLRRQGDSAVLQRAAAIASLRAQRRPSRRAARPRLPQSIDALRGSHPTCMSPRPALRARKAGAIKGVRPSPEPPCTRYLLGQDAPSARRAIRRAQRRREKAARHLGFMARPRTASPAGDKPVLSLGRRKRRLLLPGSAG